MHIDSLGQSPQCHKAVFLKFLENYQKELVEERSTTFEGLVVRVLFELLENGEVNISSSDITDIMNEKYSRSDGKKHSNVRVGKTLKGLGLEMERKRVERKTKRCVNWKENQSNNNFYLDRWISNSSSMVYWFVEDCFSLFYS